jgi:hypothetical protein
MTHEKSSVTCSKRGRAPRRTGRLTVGLNVSTKHIDNIITINIIIIIISTGCGKQTYIFLWVYSYKKCSYLAAPVLLLLLLLLILILDPRGGGLEYHYRTPAKSYKRRRKENTVPEGITGPPSSWGI